MIPSDPEKNQRANVLYTCPATGCGDRSIPADELTVIHDPDLDGYVVRGFCTGHGGMFELRIAPRLSSENRMLGELLLMAEVEMKLTSPEEE